MDNLIEKSEEQAVDTKKPWVAPELKKVDVDEVTAHGDEGANDTLGFS